MTLTRAAVGVLMVFGLAGVGAAPAPAQPEALCLPLLMSCSNPSPSPSSGSGGLGGLVGGLLGGQSVVPGAAAIPDPLADPNAPTFTQPSAQLGGDSISFTGLKAVSVVTVGLADGSRIPVIKLEADDIIITGFVLDVRRSTGPALVNTATTMELKGNVQVYVNSLTASTLDGLGLSLLAPTPPPNNELPAQLLRVNLGLVGVTANSIHFAASHQAIHEE